MNINDINHLRPFQHKGNSYRVTSITKSKTHKWINGEMRFKWKVGVLNIQNAKIEYWYFGYDNIKY